MFGSAMCEDTYIWENNPDYNYGGDIVMYLDASTKAGIIRFKDLTDSLPENVTVESCTLYVWAYEGCQDIAGLYAYRCFKTGWVEGTGTGQDVAGATWNDWSADDYEWGTAGAANASDAGSDNEGDGSGYDRKSTAEGSDECPGEGDTWLTIPITAAFVQERYDNGAGDDDVNLVLVRTQNYPKIIASEYLGDESLRPYLAVNYSIGGDTFKWGWFTEP